MTKGKRITNKLLTNYAPMNFSNYYNIKYKKFFGIQPVELLFSIKCCFSKINCLFSGSIIVKSKLFKIRSISYKKDINKKSVHSLYPEILVLLKVFSLGEAIDSCLFTYMLKHDYRDQLEINHLLSINCNH